MWNGTTEEVQRIVNILNEGQVPSSDVVDVVISPTFVFLQLVKRLLKPQFHVAAQNCWINSVGGALTGEVSAETLVNLDIPWVILGHSERRHILNESNEFVGRKVAYALSQGLKVIACVGETLEQRQARSTKEVLAAQVEAIGDRVSNWSNIVFAYEPVWATGKVATPAQAQEVHFELRKWLRENTSPGVATTTRIIYGGFVNGTNCKELASQPDVDGFLVGGASLKPEFIDIIKSLDVKKNSEGANTNEGVPYEETDDANTALVPYKEADNNGELILPANEEAGANVTNEEAGPNVANEAAGANVANEEADANALVPHEEADANVLPQADANVLPQAEANVLPQEEADANVLPHEEADANVVVPLEEADNNSSRLRSVCYNLRNIQRPQYLVLHNPPIVGNQATPRRQTPRRRRAPRHHQAPIQADERAHFNEVEGGVDAVHAPILANERADFDEGLDVVDQPAQENEVPREVSVEFAEFIAFCKDTVSGIDEFEAISIAERVYLETVSWGQSEELACRLGKKSICDFVRIQLLH